MYVLSDSTAKSGGLIIVSFFYRVIFQLFICLFFVLAKVVNILTDNHPINISGKNIKTNANNCYIRN